jgi:hypothetical protein
MNFRRPAGSRMMLRRLLLSLLLLMLLGGEGQVGRRCRVAKPSVLRQAGHRAEGLPALVTFDLHPAGGVHPLVPAQVGELRVALEADLATEGLDGAVDVRVLLQAGAGGERLAALRTRVASSADVVCSDVTLKVARIGEDLVAVFAGKPAVLAVNHFVSEKVWPPGEALGAVLALVLTAVVTVGLHHVVVQSEIKLNEVYY